MLEKSKVIVKEDFLRAGPSSLKKDDICAYIEKLAHSEIEALISYLELLANNVSFSIDEAPRRIQGALKLYKKLKAEERINFLENIREKIVMTNLGENDKSLYSLVNIITNEKRKNIFEYLNKADSLSLEYQAIFIDEIYKDITKHYSKIIKENRINKCNHCFDSWKDCSYTLEEETRIDLQLTRVPVEHIRFERKCKKCGYVEVVDYIPKVVAEKRQITAKKNKIKKLRRELNKVEKKLEDTTKEIATMNREIRRF